MKVNSAKVEGKQVVLDTELVKDGKKEEMKADIVLVSAGKSSTSLLLLLGKPVL